MIMPVVSRNTIKRGNKRFVKLGDKEIVLNDAGRGRVGRSSQRVERQWDDVFSTDLWCTFRPLAPLV